MRWLSLPIVLLAGCWVTAAELDAKLGGEGDDTDTDDGGPITVTAVSPPWGTAAGGTDVTITASPIGQGVAVRFGSANAEILSITETEISVRTPPGTAGLVDVDVQWGDHAGAVPAGFQYFVDGSDSYGAVGTVGWVDVVGFLAQLGYVDGGSAWVNFTDRSPYSYEAFYGASMDSCASSWAFPGTLVEASDGNAIQLTQDGTPELTLQWSASDQEYATELVAEGGAGNAWISDAVFDLEPIAGVTDYPAIATKGFVRTPSVFTVRTDCDLCGGASDLDSDTPPTVFQDDFQIEWDTTDPGDAVLIRIDLYGDVDSPDPTESIRCLAHDDGAFTVPSGVWTTDPGFSAIDLWVGRARTSTALMPHDNSRSGVAGVYWIVGTADVFPM